MPRYDIQSLKRTIKAYAEEARIAKKERREKWQAYSAVEREGVSIQRDTTERKEWWERVRKALDQAQGATSSAAWASEKSTILCSARAHVRGRLHMKKRFDTATGKYYGWTMEDQAKLVEDTLADYKLPEKTVEEKPAA